MDCDIAQIERINVIGTSGSGKSTFARKLATLLDLPHIELDQLYWKAGWEASSEEDFWPRLSDATRQQRWILDGNYAHWTQEKWKNVQLVVWLDLSLSRTMFRVTKRTLQRSVSREEIWPGTGNRETLRKCFLSRDSIVWWALTTHGPNRQKYVAAMNAPEYAHIQFVRLRTPREVANWLIAVQEQSRLVV